MSPPLGTTVGRSAIVFSMPQRGHFNRLRPLISGLATAGVPTHVFTDRCFRDEVAQSGGRFVDLFAGRPIEAVDATSIPVPCRYVSFAGHCADDIVQEVATLRAGVVVHDTFAVIGTAVANRLALPRVNVCAGHNFPPVPTAETLQLPQVIVSDECRRAARVLRERYGMADAGPFSCFSALSTDLNVYCEPPEFLHPEERVQFEPIAFFGSLATDEDHGATLAASPFGKDSGRKLRLYTSFGTVVWRYYEAEALRALEAICEAIAPIDEAVAVVSLGGRSPTTRTAQLARRNVRVEHYVDQWQVLREASVFITHQGLNSTHEAVFHQTPMISYPFLSDQPGLAKRCQELGLAVPLVAALRGPIDPGDVRTALARVAAGREAMRERLAAARRWELETMAARGSVIKRIIRLMR